MQLFNNIIHIALTIGMLGACLMAILLWWRYREKPLYTQSSYWAYVTIGLFFILVSKYADIYAPLSSLERALYAYVTTTLFLLGMIFIFIAIKRLLATILDLH